MRRQLRRRDRIRLKNIGGIAVLVVAAMVIGVILWFGILGPPPRGADNCTKDGPQSITVLAVDATDVLDGVQRLSLRNELTKIIDGLHSDDGVQIWRVAPSEDSVPDAAGPLLCNPGETVNRLFANPAIARKLYVDKFKKPLLDELERFMERASEDQSPIMESIQAIGLRAFDGPEFGKVKDKRLVLASDLIQNTSTYSQLHGVESFHTFQQTVSSKKLAAHMPTVRVQVLYIQRPNAPSYKQHIEFWQQYFFQSGASLDSVMPVVGMNQ